MNKSTPFRRARALLFLTLPSLAATVHAAVLVNLDATGLPLGPLATWNNTGTVAGNFAASGAPAVTSVAGVNAVTLTGNPDFYTGPAAPASVTGVNPSRSIEVWAYNPSIAGEETLIAWGRRGGGDGTNIAFNYGNSGAFGAVGHWGGPDIGWNNAGGAPTEGIWHHLVYTYDGGGVAGAGTTRVYADGVLMNSEFLGTLDTYADFPFVVGGQNNETTQLPAGFNSGLSIARIRVHDVALSDAQIAAQFTAEKATFFPAAFVSSSKVQSSSSFVFTITDQPPASVTNPASFTIAADGVRAGWQVLGGEGVLDGSIASPEITVPGGNVEFSLLHRYNFEDGATPWDGGVVQYSVNGGEWITVDASLFTEGGYFALPLIGTGVLNGSNGFNGLSPGFATGALITSTATVPAAQPGDTIRLRCLGAWDEGFTPDGIDWNIAGLTVRSAGSVVYTEDFSTGDGGWTGESTAAGSTWNYLSGNLPVIGALQVTKTGDITTLSLPIQWAPGRTYGFTLTGKDANGGDLVFPVSVATPSLPLANGQDWPASVPGPMGSNGTWGVRTYLNEGIDFSEDLVSVLSFLASADERTPALTPDTVIDTQEPGLNFVDPESNGPAGVIGCPRPFPANALSTATNGGATRADDHVVTSAHGSILITEASDYTFNLRGDDGMMFRIRAAGGADPEFLAVGGAGQVDAEARNIVFVPLGTGDQNTRAIVHLTPGVYNLEYVTWEGGGGFWYQVSAAKGFFANDADTNTWALVGFQTDRTAPVTYPAIVGDWTVLSSPPDVLAPATIAGANAVVDAAVAADAAAATSYWAQINFFDPQNGGTGTIPGDVPWPRNADPILDVDGNVIDNGDDDKYAMRMTGTMHIAEAGEYLIGFQGDDGAQITVGGVNAGFSALTENATGAGIIGKGNNPVANSGSAGAAANSDPDTSVTFQVDGALAGSTNKAISVDGNGGPKVTVPYVPALNPLGAGGDAAPFTVEAWAKPVDLAGGQQAIVNSMIAGANQNPANGNDRSGFSLRLNNGDWQFYLGYTDGAPFYDVNAAFGAVIENEWQHVVGVWDGTESRLYVNGVLANTTNPVEANGSAPKGNYAAPLYLGKRGFGDWLFKGAIDEAAVYDTALDAETILTHYENGVNAARTTPYETLVLASNPVGYWRLNDMVGPRVDLGTITTDVATGNSRTVGRIFLNPGDYPITATYWEDGGGSYIEVFAGAEIPGGCVPIQLLRKDGYASVPSSSGLELVSPPPPVPPSIVGGLTRNPDGALSLTFASVPNASYTLESSTDLNTWLELNDNIVATGATTTVTGTPGVYFFYDPAAPRKYYRIRAN